LTDMRLPGMRLPALPVSRLGPGPSTHRAASHSYSGTSQSPCVASHVASCTHTHTHTHTLTRSFALSPLCYYPGPSYHVRLPLRALGTRPNSNTVVVSIDYRSTRAKISPSRIAASAHRLVLVPPVLVFLRLCAYPHTTTPLTAPSAVFASLSYRPVAAWCAIIPKVRASRSLGPTQLQSWFDRVNLALRHPSPINACPQANTCSLSCAPPN